MIICHGVSSFKSLMTILAGTLGVGNIVGVATAITLGGIGSIFWIFISGVFAMATKYAETYIPLKYREVKKNKYIGGAMYVLKNRLDLKILATLFSLFVICSSFGGAMIQSNAMTETISLDTNISKTIIAVIVTMFSCYVIFGNEERISTVSSIIVPIAIVIYVHMCIYLMISFKDNIINSIFLIVKEAFQFQSVCGGFLASAAINAMNVGMSKGLYSNEAGMGSSPLFNVSVNTKKSIKEESIIASTSVFIDTVLLCTITGILIVASGMYQEVTNPIDIVNNVFSMVPYGKFLLMVSISIFAISTLPCTGYYGVVGINYIFQNKKFYEIVYKMIYTICIYIGCLSTVKVVWSISSIFNAFMIFPNLILIYKLRKEIRA
ncbi:MAG: amino acid carrier protein [Clostridia bacterium]|nr:amino acid carrier protein [Clostridia bacterium]